MTEDEVQQRLNEQERLELAHAYKRFSMTDDGKVILADLRSFCGQDRSSICESDPNPYQTFGAEGKRRVFLRINSMINRKEEG